MKCKAHGSRSASYAFAPPELRRTGRIACDAPAWLEHITLDEKLVLCVGETPNAVLSVFRETANELELHASAHVGGDGAVSIAIVRMPYGAQVFVGTWPAHTQPTTRRDPCPCSTSRTTARSARRTPYPSTAAATGVSQTARKCRTHTR